MSPLTAGYNEKQGERDTKIDITKGDSGEYHAVVCDSRVNNIYNK